MLFKTRSFEKEMLDAPVIPTEDLHQNLTELDVINKQLGGYRASLNSVREVLKRKPGAKTLLDLGFGGGGSIKYLAHHVRQKHSDLFFFGADIKKDCMTFAELNLRKIPNKQLLLSDYRNIDHGFLQHVDIIHCSLFLHHLTDREIIDLFNFCRSTNCILVINDLHRHWLAYYSIRLLTFLFSKSALVKNDAPLSVKRGFKRKELINLLSQGGFTIYKIRWNWPFRFTVIAEK